MPCDRVYDSAHVPGVPTRVNQAFPPGMAAYIQSSSIDWMPDGMTTDRFWPVLREKHINFIAKLTLYRHVYKKAV